jgi:hypothetical protein
MRNFLLPAFVLLSSPVVSLTYAFRILLIKVPAVEECDATKDQFLLTARLIKNYFSLNHYYQKIKPAIADRLKNILSFLL